MNPKINKNQNLTVKQKSISAISALTAKGDLEKLRKTLDEGLDSGLTINEIKEVLVQLYAYCGFPRSLQSINTFIAVLEDRKKKGITDVKGKKSSPIANKENKYERGKKVLETLTGKPEPAQKTGANAFSPEIDVFLKEHLFADIFERDVLNYVDREITTISALMSLGNVEPQLTGHLNIGINVGLNESQLNEIISIVESNVGKKEAETGRKVLAEILKKSTNIQNTENNADTGIFPKGDKAPAENFTGVVWVKPLVPKTANNNYSIGSVTFEAGARSNWHTHPAGQTLLVIEGRGLYQEKGKPIRTINKGDAIVCDADIEHWHGASPESEMTHIAITNFKGDSGVIWLKPVTDAEYISGLK